MAASSITYDNDICHEFTGVKLRKKYLSVDDVSSAMQDNRKGDIPTNTREEILLI